MKRIEVLDCTLRDGAYIVNGEFGSNAISGIMGGLQRAGIDIIECGWLKDQEHTGGTTYYHVPEDILPYMIMPKDPLITYVAMIDYNRYDCSRLPVCDGRTIDAIRVVFPRGKEKEGIAVCEQVKEKGYRVFIQLANTPGYSDRQLLDVIEMINRVKPECVSIVDTFGKMYPADLTHIMSIMDRNLDRSIRMGFHSHNNMQLSFALAMQFIENAKQLSSRRIVVDSSLCGMGRGAGNTCTELLAEYVNRIHNSEYDMNAIMDTIDRYMLSFSEEYRWGYSIPYAIAGIYGCHVNNVAYLTRVHRTGSKDMKIIFESLPADKRIQYDYDNLEAVYAAYQNNDVDDAQAMQGLKEEFGGKSVVCILPGRSSELRKDEVDAAIAEKSSVVVGINAIVPGYHYDYLFFTNEVKYEFASSAFPEEMKRSKHILTSNIRSENAAEACVINYYNVVKRGWKYYDNSMIMFLRLMRRALPEEIGIAGFDGYRTEVSEYADSVLKPTLSADEYAVMQEEITDMLRDFKNISAGDFRIRFITASPFAKIFE